MGARRLQEDSSEAWDQVDVPAAVVCALCGDPGCGGCSFETTTTRSGIVAILPWERPGGGPLLGRLWATARATTKDPESLFGSLPDGPVAPALAFAVVAELIAALSWSVVWALALIAIFPVWSRHVAFDPSTRGLALRVAVAAWPSFAFLLVVAHAAHGLSLDHGAVKVGAPSSRRRALRFGLYATGWDLVIGPLGAVVLALKEGASAAAEVAGFGAGLPTRSSTAFLRGAYRLEGANLKRALTSSYVAAVVATLVAAFVVLGVVVAAILLFPPNLASF